MTQEIMSYPNLEATKQAVKRTEQRHKDGQEPDNIIKNTDGTYSITWIHDDDPEHSTNQDQTEFLREKELITKLKARTISQPELLEFIEKRLL